MPHRPPWGEFNRRMRAESSCSVVSATVTGDPGPADNVGPRRREPRGDRRPGASIDDRADPPGRHREHPGRPGVPRPGRLGPGVFLVAPDCCAARDSTYRSTMPWIRCVRPRHATAVPPTSGNPRRRRGRSRRCRPASAQAPSSQRVGSSAARRPARRPRSQPIRRPADALRLVSLARTWSISSHLRPGGRGATRGQAIASAMRDPTSGAGARTEYATGGDDETRPGSGRAGAADWLERSDARAASVGEVHQPCRRHQAQRHRPGEVGPTLRGPGPERRDPRSRARSRRPSAASANACGRTAGRAPAGLVEDACLARL